MRRLRAYHILVPLAIVLIFLVFAAAYQSMAAANTVESSKFSSTLHSALANDIKPAACASLNLSTITFCSGSGTCRGTGGNNLILGTAGNDTIRARNGSDCIIAGGGNDDVDGDNGSDICIEGPGADTYASCTVVNP